LTGTGMAGVFGAIILDLEPLRGKSLLQYFFDLLNTSRQSLLLAASSHDLF